MVGKQPDKPRSQILIYRSEAGETKIEVRLQDETVWLTQRGMAELFQTSVPNINLHLSNIFEESELDSGATIKDFLIVQKEGDREVTRTNKFYNLDAIISVGYRIKSKTATRFRRRASQTPHPHDHGRLARETARFSAIERTGNSGSRRENFSRTGKRTGRIGIC